MNFSEMFPSRFLTQDELSTPRVLVIAKVDMQEVRQPNGKVNKPVVHFQVGKPMILNKTNGAAIAKAYGRNTDAWAGKPIEVYAEPTVMMKGETVGGIRVRIPVANKSTPTTNGAQTKPAAQKPATPAPMSVEEKHQAVMDGYEYARTAAKVKEFATWAADQDFPKHLIEEQSDAYHLAMEQFAPTSIPAAAPGAPMYENIPF